MWNRIPLIASESVQNARLTWRINIDGADARFLLCVSHNILHDFLSRSCCTLSGLSWPAWTLFESLYFTRCRSRLFRESCWIFHCTLLVKSGSKVEIFNCCCRQHDECVDIVKTRALFGVVKHQFSTNLETAIKLKLSTLV